MCAGFLSRREVLLTNTSEIPMTYRLRVSGSEAEEIEGGEFEVKPKSGVLPPNYNQTIQVYNIVFTNTRKTDCKQLQMDRVDVFVYTSTYIHALSDLVLFSSD